MTGTHAITTAEQLLAATDLGRCELVRGELVMMSPAGFRHSRIALRIGSILMEYAERHGLGTVTNADCGFYIASNPDTVRAPDAAFVRAERIPAVEPVGFFRGAPDLAVEVLSPDDRKREVLAKVQEWLAAGCQVVWVVDPDKETVAVYSSSGAEHFQQSDTLSGRDVLPGFSLAVAEIFAR
jgi:Uma2 family endonuclease